MSSVPEMQGLVDVAGGGAVVCLVSGVRVSVRSELEAPALEELQRRMRMLTGDVWEVVVEPGMRVVLCHGTFDLLHLGHVRMFQAARAMGDRLVVTITADAYVHKGPGRPIYNEYERLEMVRSCREVDHAEISRERTGISMIQKWAPTFYVKGGDYRIEDKNGALERERRAVEDLGGELAIVDGPQFPSSTLIERVARWREAQPA